MLNGIPAESDVLQPSGGSSHGRVHNSGEPKNGWNPEQTMVKLQTCKTNFTGPVAGTLWVAQAS